MRQELKFGERRFLITINARIAWWVRPYLKVVRLIALATGVNPDMDKVTRRVMRGIRTRTVSRPSH
ncbi:hypothetical protein Cmtc_08710 [Cupriavidus sp. TKC]|uniref:hypothetical protein n=1 Tax=Cupriavidus sp. TKC TaxID=2880159 RepID=UPI0025A7DF43|nr:hypothetical protein [Cupriavidus sp. TKC]GMG89651.1 hypothetical protein Cmtc_08710 [Cupriavidus sp. TKC]